ncbi:hypothetical protein BDR07DRAFT_887943 [Suillus spraguei]|nr:hypothetical protein BDR07DRAFT_1011301 [Suillus spraguei]KAG2363728.1 hypothetical protein BDR07DRAFT_887943 [Suillus spraguei]
MSSSISAILVAVSARDEAIKSAQHALFLDPARSLPDSALQQASTSLALFLLSDNIGYESHSMSPFLLRYLNKIPVHFSCMACLTRSHSPSTFLPVLLGELR